MAYCSIYLRLGRRSSNVVGLINFIAFTRINNSCNISIVALKIGLLIHVHCLRIVLTNLSSAYSKYELVLIQRNLTVSSLLKISRTSKRKVTLALKCMANYKFNA